MDLFNNPNELKKNLGTKRKPWDPGLIYISSNPQYIGGFPKIDGQISDNSKALDVKEFYKWENGLEIGLNIGFVQYKVGIFDHEIAFWSLEKQETISEKKSKSVIGRALVGGLLLGPVGAIVGSISGIGDKNVTKSITGIDNLLTISVKNDEGEFLLVFTVKNKKVKNILGFFNRNYPDKFLKEPIPETSNADNQNSDSTSIADELIKLKDLLDKGLLSNEEFENLKQRLLS